MQLSWSKDLEVDEHEFVIPEPGCRYRVTEVFLVDPMSAGDKDVTVSIKAGDHALVLGPMSAYNPDADLRSVLALDEAFRLDRCDDSTKKTVVRFEGYVLTEPDDEDQMPAESIDELVQLHGGTSESEDEDSEVDVPLNIHGDGARTSSPPLCTRVLPEVAGKRAAGRSPTNQGAGVVPPPATERSFPRRPYFYR